MEKTVYPDFDKVADGLEVIKKITRSFLPYSDFNIISLICWNQENENRFSMLDKNLVIKVKDYLKDSYSYSLIGNHSITSSINKLLNDDRKLSYIPEFVVNKLRGKNHYEITEDRDSFDYVFEIDDLCCLEGGSQKSNRKRIHSFQKFHEGYTVKLLDLSNKHIQEELLELTTKWAKCKKMTTQQIEEDCKMISTFCYFAKFFDTLSTGLYIDNRLIAVSFNELLENGWVMGHFGNSDISYEYSALVLEHETSKLLKSKDFKYLNHQQDTGILGLREYKMSLKPAFFLKKYFVNYKED
jgi:hypothetical protein